MTGMITKIGFTGPRTGMSEEQQDMLHFLLRNFREAKPTTHSVVEFYHGDCVGADAQAHEIARYLDYRITTFPPQNPSLRAFCEADEVLPTKPYLERDRNIVDASELLLAAVNFPASSRSGSWYTYRYAQENFKRAWLL
jgi:hypothetical protein